MIPETRQAGRELDAIVAVDVMGGRWEGGYLYSHVKSEKGWLLAVRDSARFGDEELHVYQEALPQYSTDIASAWLVVEKMRERGYEPTITHHALGWSVIFDDYSSVVACADNAETVSLAICLAAIVTQAGA